MKFTHNLITLLALTSVTAAIAGDNRWFAGKYRPAAKSTASVNDYVARGNRWFAGKYRPAVKSKLNEAAARRGTVVSAAQSIKTA